MLWKQGRVRSSHRLPTLATPLYTCFTHPTYPAPWRVMEFNWPLHFTWFHKHWSCGRVNPNPSICHSVICFYYLPPFLIRLGQSSHNISSTHTHSQSLLRLFLASGAVWVHLNVKLIHLHKKPDTTQLALPAPRQTAGITNQSRSIRHSFLGVQKHLNPSPCMLSVNHYKPKDSKKAKKSYLNKNKIF